MDQAALRKLVFESLNNALEGGYDLRDKDPQFVATDMAVYQSEIEDYCADNPDKVARDIVPLVKEWQCQCHEGV